MHALPFLVALVAAVVVAPSAVHTLAATGHTRANYRDRQVPLPFGVAAALVALVPLALVQELGVAPVFHPELSAILIYLLGVALLGLIDDVLSESSRGWREHRDTVLRGGFSTGALKAGGSLGLALVVMSGRGLTAGRYLLASAVLVLATNAFNLLDLRPGWSIKAFVVLAVGLSVGTMDLRRMWALGLFVAPILVAGPYDLRERAMLGDTGSNLVGALAGLCLVLSLSDTGQAVAAALLAAITIYGEFRSISGLVERTPGLRALDFWGRP